MITGRGPGAPSVTPDMVLTLREPRHDQAVDLTAIRHTDAVIDLIGSRRLRRPHTSGDPALVLLGSLAADVDRSGGAAADVDRSGGAAADVDRSGGAAADIGHPGGAAPEAGQPGRPHAGAAADGGGVPDRATGGNWVQATAAAAMISSAVAVLAVTGLVIAGVLMRMTGMPAWMWLRRSRGQGPGRPSRA